MKKRVSKFCSFLLVFCLLAGMWSVYPAVQAKASESDSEYTTIQALSDLNFDMGTSELEKAIHSGDTPYGNSDIAIKTVDELFRMHSFAVDDNTSIQEGNYENYYNYKWNGNTAQGVWADAITKSTVAYNESNIGSFHHILNAASVAFNGNGNGKDDCIALIEGLKDENHSETKMCLKIISTKAATDTQSDVSDSIVLNQVLCYLPFDVLAYYTGAYFSITAGDYDGDGIDEIAVYVPDSSSGPCVKLYKVDLDIKKLTELKTINISTIVSFEKNKQSLMMFEEYFTDPYELQKYIPIVNLETMEQDGDYTDDLIITASHPRYDYYLTQTGYSQHSDKVSARYKARVLAATKVSVYQTVLEKDMQNQVFTMNWLNSRYGGAGYGVQVMMSGGAATGDIDHDGVKEIVVAGNVLADSELQDDDWEYSHDEMLVSTIKYNSSTRRYDNYPSLAQFISMDSDDYDGAISLNDAFEDDDNKWDVVHAPLCVECFAERGDGYADSVFVNGVVIGIKSTIGATGTVTVNQESDYDYIGCPDKTFKKKIDDIPSTERFVVRYAVPLSTRDTESNYRAVAEAVSGNFDGNAAGVETLKFTYVTKLREQLKYRWSVETIMQKTVGNLENQNKTQDQAFENIIWDGAYTAPGGFGMFESTSYYKYSSCTIAKPDYDSDSVILRPKRGVDPDFDFDDPHVIAVLQAAPYFKELDYEAYAANNTTSFGKSSGSGDSLSNEFSVTAGITVGIEQEVSVIVKIAEFSTKASVSFSAGGAFTKDTMVTKSNGYTASLED